MDLPVNDFKRAILAGRPQIGLWVSVGSGGRIVTSWSRVSFSDPQWAKSWFMAVFSLVKSVLSCFAVSGRFADSTECVGGDNAAGVMECA